MFARTPFLLLVLAAVVSVRWSLAAISAADRSAPARAELQLTEPQTFDRLKEGDPIEFEGEATQPVHRAGPEHFRLEEVAAAGKAVPLSGWRMIDEPTQSPHPYNCHWKGVQLCLLPKGARLRSMTGLSDRHVRLAVYANLRPGVRYRLTWACWPVGAVRAIERSCEFEIPK